MDNRVECFGRCVGIVTALFVMYIFEALRLLRASIAKSGAADRPHIGPGSLGIPRKTYLYLFFWIFEYF